MPVFTVFLPYVQFVTVFDHFWPYKRAKCYPYAGFFNLNFHQSYFQNFHSTWLNIAAIHWCMAPMLTGRNQGKVVCWIPIYLNGPLIRFQHLPLNNPISQKKIPIIHPDLGKMIIICAWLHGVCVFWHKSPKVGKKLGFISKFA